jgi:hypothetical protein
MSLFFASRYRWLISVSIALLGALAVGVWLINGAPVYGQAAADARIPDLRGQWQGELTGYIFTNALQPTDTDPQYLHQISTPEEIISIDVQTGRAFAGSTPDGAVLTGVLLPDGTIRIQALGEGELRLFGTLKLVIERGQHVMTGTMNAFDDLKDGTDKSLMGTVFARYVKMN